MAKSKPKPKKERVRGGSMAPKAGVKPGSRYDCGGKIKK